MCNLYSVKCCFIFLNMLFSASGVALIIIGVQEYSTYSLLGAFAMASLSKISIVLIAVGVAIILVSLLGYLGAFFNNQSTVSCFLSILIIIIFLQIITGTVFYLLGNQMKAVINNKTQMVIHEYNPEKRQAIDEIQEKFRCCGANGYIDWSTNVGWKNHDAAPDSCCVVKSQDCGQDKENVRTNVHTKGCVKAIDTFMTNNLRWVSAVCICLGIAEVLEVFVGVCFGLTIKKKSYENMS